jgi:hypothetical protein
MDRIGECLPTQELAAAANWIIEPSRPMAAPDATEKAEEIVRHRVAANGM